MPEISDSFQITRPDFGKNPATFLKEVRAELKKVSWPNRTQVIKLTAVVIGVSLVVAAYLGGLDYIFAKGIEILLRK
jgi:preprotein translocase subunit SecE